MVEDRCRNSRRSLCVWLTVLVTLQASPVRADPPAVPEHHAPLITARGTPTGPKPAGYFPDPYKTSCRSTGAFRDGLKHNPVEGPQALRYRSNANETITFSWSCPHDVETDPAGRVVRKRTSSFWIFCCDCPDNASQHFRPVVDELGNPASELTFSVEPAHDYAWAVSCENTLRESNEVTPTELSAHPNVARLGNPGSVMEYRYYPGTYATSIDDEMRERRRKSEEELERNKKRFEDGLRAAKDKQRFTRQWNAEMRHH